MKYTRQLLAILACLLICFPGQLLAQYQIDAQVDKEEVAFGDALNLVVTITQEITGGGTLRSIRPEIGEIPGFDIASTRSGQSTSLINGAGVLRSQVVLELVPREAGKKVIPAFSFTDPSGKKHSTSPIEVTVLPPRQSPGQEEEKGDSDSEPRLPEDSGGFRTYLVGGLIFFFIISIPFLLAIFSGNRSSDEDSGAGVEDAVIVEESSGQKLDERNEIKKPVAEKFDFAKAVGELKRKNPEADMEFYREYFSLFKKAAVCQSSSLSEDLTPDELMNKVREMNLVDSTHQATIRVAGEIEMVMYAGQVPVRSFSAIDEDVRLILAGID